MFMSWIPGETEWQDCAFRVRPIAGRDNRGHFTIARRSGSRKRLGADLLEIPVHAPYLAGPSEFAATLLPLLNPSIQGWRTIPTAPQPDAERRNNT